MRVRSKVALTLSIASSLVMLGDDATASAQAGSDTPVPQEAQPKRKGAQNSGLSGEALQVMLASDDADEVRFAIDAISQAHKAPFMPLLVERVRAGLPATLLLPALDALVAAGGPEATELLGELTTHRRHEVRERALLGLAASHADNAEALLVAGLSDVDPAVRASAAEGLALLGAHGSLPALFRAFERNVGGAAAAIGQLAEPTSIPRIVDYLGRTSFLELTPLLDGVLLRRDLDEGAKVILIDAIVSQGTAEARGYLEGLPPRLPANTPARFLGIVQGAAARMPK